MKQTAVDWLIEQLTPSISLQQKHIENDCCIFQWLLARHHKIKNHFAARHNHCQCDD